MRSLLPCEAEVYVRQAEIAVRDQPRLKHRPLQITCEGGRLHLAGQVESYFEKQMAQEALRRFDRGAPIENQLVVHWDA